jgi:hypothetical protein
MADFRAGCHLGAIDLYLLLALQPAWRESKIQSQRIKGLPRKVTQNPGHPAFRNGSGRMQSEGFYNA